MEGIISGIKRMEIHDGDGIRTTVFFKGCPLRCLWCHNPESLQAKSQIGVFQGKCLHCGSCTQSCPEDAIVNSVVDFSRCTGCLRCAEECPGEAITAFGQRWEAQALAQKLMADRAFFETSGGGVTLSGGECLQQPAFAAELAKLLQEAGISVYVDTCGFVSRSALERIIPYTDCFLYDLKAMDPDVHRRCTGQENGLILENLQYLAQRGCAVEIRYPLVVGYNHQECDAIGSFLQTLPGIRKVKVLQYHRFAASRYQALGMECTLPDTQTTPEDVAAAVTCLRSYGLNAVNGITED